MAPLNSFAMHLVQHDSEENLQLIPSNYEKCFFVKPHLLVAAKWRNVGSTPCESFWPQDTIRRELNISIYFNIYFKK